MDKINVEIPAQLCGVSTKADGSLSLRFNTAKEMNAEEMAQIMSYNRHEGYLLFSLNTFQESDIPKENAPISGKSPSKRLHDVLYVYWKEKGFKDDFEVFYKKKMNNIIETVKDTLPNREF